MLEVRNRLLIDRSETAVNSCDLSIWMISFIQTSSMTCEDRRWHHYSLIRPEKADWLQLQHRCMHWVSHSSHSVSWPDQPEEFLWLKCVSIPSGQSDTNYESLMWLMVTWLFLCVSDSLQSDQPDLSDLSDAIDMSRVSETDTSD